MERRSIRKQKTFWMFTGEKTKDREYRYLLYDVCFDTEEETSKIGRVLAETLGIVKNEMCEMPFITPGKMVMGYYTEKKDKSIIFIPTDCDQTDLLLQYVEEIGYRNQQIITVVYEVLETFEEMNARENALLDEIFSEAEIDYDFDLSALDDDNTLDLDDERCVDQEEQ